MTGSNHQKARAPRTRPASPRGFALLVAIILSAIAAAVTISLTTLAYKGLLLSSTARESQYAFYAADSAVECALYWDNSAHTAFAYTTTPSSPTINCAGVNVTLTASTYDSHTNKYLSPWFAINTQTVNGVTTSDCARITVYKGDSSQDPGTRIFGDGANTSCATLGTNPRVVERGLKAIY